MSIEQKIAQLLEEAQKLQAESVESLSEEEFNALSEEEQAEYELDEASSCYKKKEMKEEAEQLGEDAYAGNSPEMTHHKLVDGKPNVPKKIGSRDIHLHHIGTGNPTGEKAQYKVVAVGSKSKLASKHNLKVGSTVSGTHVNDHMDYGTGGGHVHVHTAKPKAHFMEEAEQELKVDVSEDVAALINGEELTEEFKAKAATIFEAAVVTRVKAEIAKIEEQFETQLAEQVEQIKEGLVEKVDGYLNYVVEQWMTDNELALENGMKTEIMESFIAGMKNLFMEHYIEVPAEKYDLVGELEEQAEAMKAKLDEQLAANVELSKQVNEMKRTSSIEEFCADLADTDAEKFKGLAEELAYEDVESFKTKLQTIKENYFGKKATPNVSSVVTDDPVQLDEEAKTIDPVMAKYLAALK